MKKRLKSLCTDTTKTLHSAIKQLNDYTQETEGKEYTRIYDNTFNNIVHKYSGVDKSTLQSMKNKRELWNREDRYKTAFIEQLVALYYLEGIGKQLPRKEIYQFARKRIGELVAFKMT